jgi:hypothetical protein
MKTLAGQSRGSNPPGDTPPQIGRKIIHALNFGKMSFGGWIWAGHFDVASWVTMTI